MSVYDAIRAANGVTSYINSQSKKIDIGKPKNKSYRQQEIHLNNLLLKFGSDNGIKLLKNNNRNYKGSFSPYMSNCKIIQENFKLFTKWLDNNFSIINSN